MSAPLRRWPRWAALMMDVIDQGRARNGLPAVPVGMSYNATKDPLPRYIVGVVDGAADKLDADVLIAIDTIAETYTEAERLAYDVDDILMGYPLSASSDGRVVLLDVVEVVDIPVEVDLDEDTSTRRFLATYQLSIRRG